MCKIVRGMVVGFLRSIGVLAFVFVSGFGYSQLLFHEDFNDRANIIFSTANVSGGVLEVGYPDVDSGYQWSLEWGDFAFYGGNFYIVWADTRYEGYPQVFLTKMDQNGNILFSTNIEISMVATTNSNLYHRIAVRPTISVYDQNHVYVSFGYNFDNFYRVIVSRWQDTGSGFNLVWSRRADNGFGDNVSYTPILYKVSTAVDAGGNLYILQVWHRIGGGQTSHVSKITPDGVNQYWVSGNSPGAMFLTAFNSGSFIIAGEVIYLDGFIYATGQHWFWSPVRDFGVGVNKISTNNAYTAHWGDGTNVSGRGVIYNSMLNDAPKVDIAFFGGDLFIVFADRRNGNPDVFITRIRTNDGSFVWSPPVRVVAGGSGRQEYPSVAFDEVGNIYVSFVETLGGLRRIKLARVDQSGVVQGIESLDSALYSPSYNIGQPKLYVTPSGERFIFFYEDGGVGRRKLKVAKYNNLGNLLFVKELQDVDFKKRSSMLSTRILGNIVGTATSVRLNAAFASNGQSIMFFTSPDGVSWYLTATNTTVNFTNIGNDLRVRVVFEGNGKTNFYVDSYTLEVISYYSGDLFSSTNSNFAVSVGSNFLNRLLSSQVITNYVLADGVNKSVFYIKLQNLGNSSGRFYLYGSLSKPWSYKIFDALGNDVRSQVNSGTYNILIPAGGSTNFRLEVTPPSLASDGEVAEFYLYVSATNGNYLHDAFTFVTYARKYLPDLAISNFSGIIGTNQFELSPLYQVWGSAANSRFEGYATRYTNFVYLFNRGLLNDVVMITNWFTSTLGALSEWNILVSNLSDNHLVSSYPYYLSINSGQSKVLMVVVSPKASTVTNDILNLRFYSISTNVSAVFDDLRKDSILLSFTNYKLQPDVVVSTNVLFLGSVGEGNYVSTNTSLTQSIMVRTVNEVPLTYYFKVKNDGLQSDTILVKSSGITNVGWTERYYTNSVEVTHSITNEGLLVELGEGDEVVVRAVYVPGYMVESGIEPWVRFSASSTRFTNAFDYAWARPRNIKVRPDALIGSSLEVLRGNNIYNSSGSNQNIVNVIRKGGIEVSTNFVVVQNDSATDPDVINIVGDPPPSGWFVKYLDIFDNDITYNITNVSNFTLPLGSSVTLKVVSYPYSGVGDDEWIVVKVKAYSSYVPSQEDVVVVSNRAISVKPDLGVFSLSSGWVDSPSISYTYEGQSSLNNKVIAGNTNTFRVKLKNDTYSLQSYVFRVSVSNVGGSLRDWSFVLRAVVRGETNDITVFSTNVGWTNVFSPGEQVEVFGIVTVTNAVDIDVGTTNGAVSNLLELRYDLISVFRPNISDKGMHSFIVVRGIPDAYHESLFTGFGLVTNAFAAGNYFLYGITRNYPRGDIVLKFRNVGDHRDIFRVYAIVSNGSQPSNHLTNWVFEFFDENTNSVTYVVTNTNIGWTNSIHKGYERTLRMVVVNSNGLVNDNIFFYFYFESVTRERRVDTLWYEVIITPGLPDVGISNVVSGSVRGTNQFAPDSSDYYKVETNHTGRYAIIMRNIAPIEGYPLFKLTATLYGDVTKFDVYHTNKLGQGVDISLLTDQGRGYTNRISNYNAINGFPEDHLSVYVVPKPTATAGDKLIIRYHFSLYDNPTVYDFIYITNQVVVPRVSLLSLPTYSSNVTAYVGKYQHSFGMLIVSNGDVVWEDFIVTATQSSPNGWDIRFFTNSTDISSLMFGSGFSTGPVEGNSSVLLLFSVTNTLELVSGKTNVVTVRARSKKNTNIVSVLTINVVYVDAIADVFGRNEDDGGDFVGFGVIAGSALTNKIEVGETNVYWIGLSNSIKVGGSVRFVVSVESNYSPQFVTKILADDNTDITALVFSSNYVVTLASGQNRFIRVYRVLTNTNSLVSRGFYSYIRIGMKTLEVENNIYDQIILRDVVVDPEVEVRSASGYDNVFSIYSYSDTGKSLKAFKNTTVAIYLGIRNLDLVGERFYVKANVGSGPWDVKYYELGGRDITEMVKNGTYLTPEVEGGGFYIVKTLVKPSVEVNPADVYTQFVEVWSHKNPSRRDCVTNRVSIESMFIVGKVKNRRDGKGIPNPVVEVVDPYNIKVLVSGDADGNYSAPVYPVVGGLYNLKVDASGYVGAVTNIYFEVGTNVVDFELVPLSMGDDRVDVRIFPNPIQGGKGGSIVFAVSEDSVVSVSIYDLCGTLVKHLVKDEKKSKGVYYVLWDGTGSDGMRLKQGVYLLTITTGKEVVVKKLFVR